MLGEHSHEPVERSRTIYLTGKARSAAKEASGDRVVPEFFATEMNKSEVVFKEKELEHFKEISEDDKLNLSGSLYDSLVVNDAGNFDMLLKATKPIPKGCFV